MKGARVEEFTRELNEKACAGELVQEPGEGGHAAWSTRSASKSSEESSTKRRALEVLDGS